MTLEERLANPPNAADILNSSDMSVSGAVVVAERRYPFRSRKQYEEIRARVLQPLDALGVRTVLEMQEEQDRSSNPFRSFLKP